MLSDTRDNGATTQPIIETELEELVRLGYLNTFEDGADTYIELEKIVKGYVWSDS